MNPDDDPQLPLDPLQAEALQRAGHSIQGRAIQQPDLPPKQEMPPIPTPAQVLSDKGDVMLRDVLRRTSSDANVPEAIRVQMANDIVSKNSAQNIMNLVTKGTPPPVIAAPNLPPADLPIQSAPTPHYDQSSMPSPHNLNIATPVPGSVLAPAAASAAAPAAEAAEAASVVGTAMGTGLGISGGELAASVIKGTTKWAAAAATINTGSFSEFMPGTPGGGGGGGGNSTGLQQIIGALTKSAGGRNIF